MTEDRAVTGSGMNSVLAALRVIEEVAAHAPIGVSQLARRLDSPKSSVQRALITLEEAGWICSSGPGRGLWVLTGKALEIGLQATVSETLRDVALPILREARQASGETVQLAVREGTVVVIVASEEGWQPVRTHVDPGSRVPMYASAAGVAILAASTDDDVQRIAALPRERFTPATPSKASMLAAVSRARAHDGVGVNDTGWWRADIGAVAAAVISKRGVPTAAVSISVPLMRLDAGHIEKLSAIATSAAATVTEALRRL